MLFKKVSEILFDLLPYCDYNAEGSHANYDLVVFQKLLKKYNVEKFIEIGSNLGLSSYNIAKILPDNSEIYCIDIWCDNTRYQQFLSNITHQGVANKVFPIKLFSEEASSYFANKSIDFIYVDADHSESSVYKDISIWYPKLKNTGIMAGDDWELSSKTNTARYRLFPVKKQNHEILSEDDEHPVRKAVKRFAIEHNLDIFTQGNFWFFRSNHE